MINNYYFTIQSTYMYIEQCLGACSLNNLQKFDRFTQISIYIHFRENEKLMAALKNFHTLYLFFEPPGLVYTFFFINFLMHFLKFVFVFEIIMHITKIYNFCCKCIKIAQYLNINGFGVKTLVTTNKFSFKENNSRKNNEIYNLLNITSLSMTGFQCHELLAYCFKFYFLFIWHHC